MMLKGIAILLFFNALMFCVGGFVDYFIFSGQRLRRQWWFIVTIILELLALISLITSYVM